MAQLVRSLWIFRLLTGAPVVLLGVGIAQTGGPGALLAAVVVFELAVASALGVVSRDLVAGDRGELLVDRGGRIRWRPLQVLFVLETLELALALLLVIPFGLRFPVGLGLILPLGVLELSVWLGRRMSHAGFAAVAHLAAGNLEAAERNVAVAHLSQLRAITDAATQVDIAIALRRGKVGAARHRAETSWSGMLDDHAATLALLRLGAGDPDLAERWLVASREDRLFQRFLLALVRGMLLVHRSDWEGARAALRPDPSLALPEHYRHQLATVEAAALAGADRFDEAKVVLATVPDREWLWVPAAYPVLGALLARVGARAPAVPAPAALPAADPFAAPATPHAARPPRRYAGIGPVPVEGVPVPLGWTRRLLRLLVSVLLAMVGVLELLLSFVSYGLGHDRWSVTAISGVVLVVSGFTSVLSAVSLRTTPPGQRAVVLGDGRHLPQGVIFGLWGLGAVGMRISSALVLLSAAVLVGLNSVVPVLAIAVLLLGAAASRLRWVRIVGEASFGSASRALASLGRRGDVRSTVYGPWRALMLLWSGDGAGAEQAFTALAATRSDLRGFGAWFAAGRGEFDPGAPAPDAQAPLGERYRREVAVAIAALRNGKALEVIDRLPMWDALAAELPNRFGDLLAHLARKVAHAAGRGAAPELPEDLGWLREVWPFAA